MRSSVRKAAYLLLAALITAQALLCGCSIEKSKSGSLPRTEDSRQEIYERAHPKTGVRHPLVIVSKKTLEAGCSVSYPFVCDDGMELLNISIQTAFSEFASECGAAGSDITYSIEFNRYGLMSFLMICTGRTGRELITETANFDSDTGRRAYLSDCFGSGADYSARLMEIVERTAESEGYTFLGERPAIDDSTPFIFVYGGISLLFPEYEVFTYDAGSPRIKIPLSSVAGSVQQDGLLNRLK